MHHSHCEALPRELLDAAAGELCRVLGLLLGSDPEVLYCTLSALGTVRRGARCRGDASGRRRAGCSRLLPRNAPWSAQQPTPSDSAAAPRAAPRRGSQRLPQGLLAARPRLPPSSAHPQPSAPSLSAPAVLPLQLMYNETRRDRSGGEDYTRHVPLAVAADLARRGALKPALLMLERTADVHADMFGGVGDGR